MFSDDGLVFRLPDNLASILVFILPWVFPMLKGVVVNEYSDSAECVVLRCDWRDLLSQLPKGSVDLTVTSPPYNLGKSYDVSRDIDDFEKEQKEIIPCVIEATKPGGNICWQIGYHVKNGILTPLDYIVHSIFSSFSEVKLRNRIVWTFNSGIHGTRRLSGRHEIILWYSKGDDYHFEVDPIRVPQKYPGKKHHKGEKRGQFSGNPMGKNPGDVWSIPNVKAGSAEKTVHPCQFPIGLAQGLVMAMSPSDGLILDPYLGSGSTGVAAVLEKRRFVGTEIDFDYHRLAVERINEAIEGNVQYRRYGTPILKPSGNVAKRPPHFRNPEEMFTNDPGTSS